MKVLVIEDSPKLLRSLGYGLRKLGHSVELAADGREGLDHARLGEYDVIVLDLMLPGMDGLALLRKLRELGKRTHVLILSARDRVEDRIRGLQLGADDYMIKPFSFDELVARLNTLVRRRYEAKNPELRLGSLVVNTATRCALRDGKTVEMTPGEYAILEYLTLNRGRVLSKEQILTTLHDDQSCPGCGVVEVMVCNLRRKLAAVGEESIVKTRRGYGYYVD